MKPLSVIQELEKIAFFLQHSGLFDKFAPRTRRVLEGLPIEWVSVETGGETTLDWQEGPTWETAHLEGKLKDLPLKMDIKRDSSRYTYRILYENKEYQTSNLSNLKSIISNIAEGKVPKPKVLQSAFDLIQSNKSEIYDYVMKYFLVDVTDLTWEIKVQKDVSRIYVRFFVDLRQQMDDNVKSDILEKLKWHEFYRVDSVGSYLKALLKKEGIDSDELTFTRKFIDLAHQAGFIITIK